MKKIIATIALLALTSVSVKAELPNLGVFSLTAGLATNTSVWGASAKETRSSETGTVLGSNKDSGVFTESYSSQFIELGIGKYISLGYEVTPDSISTPNNINQSATVDGGVPSDRTVVSVDFNDLTTTYAKLNIPGGAYIKYGTVTTDLDIKETTRSGNTYKNKSTSGTSLGAGYQRFLGESGFGIRVEASYLDLDNVSTDNGVATSGNHNKVEATNLEGATARVALTYTLGRNN
tara:strand:+ start:1382 stop:2086 length:705 start_codon:yes stop_codon:yes gene_type:complete